MLPLIGQPEVAVIGSEVPLQNGSMDLLLIESSGRLVVVEVKLARNNEARRAVVAQALSYAAFLRGMTRETLGEVLASSYLWKKGFDSLEAYLEAVFQPGIASSYEFNQTMERSLSEGEFRIVFVLDEVPQDLLRLLAYLEEKTHGLTLDIITISSFLVGQSLLLLPQRIAPDIRAIAQSLILPSDGKKQGTGLFEQAVKDGPQTYRAEYNSMIAWAQQLGNENNARIFSWSGKQYVTILPYLPSENAGLVSLYYTPEKPPSIQLWRSVFEKAAPNSIEPIEVLIGKSIGQGSSTTNLSEELYALLHAAYVEARSE